MVKKITKYLKFVVCCALIMSLVAPSYAALSASDGSAFVTKAEFDAALADFNSRLTTFEAGINSKIDSQVTSYLDRNGIWNGKSQVGYPNGLIVDWMTDLANQKIWKKETMLRYKAGATGSSGTDVITAATNDFKTKVNFIPSINKAGLLYINLTWAACAQGISNSDALFWATMGPAYGSTYFYAAGQWWNLETAFGTKAPTKRLADMAENYTASNDGINVWSWANNSGAPGNGPFKVDMEFLVGDKVLTSSNMWTTPAFHVAQPVTNNGWENIGTSFGCQPPTTVTAFFFVQSGDQIDIQVHGYRTGRVFQSYLIINGGVNGVKADGSMQANLRPHGAVVIQQNDLLVY